MAVELYITELKTSIVTLELIANSYICYVVIAMPSLPMRNPRLQVDIALKGQVKGLVPVYTTFDKIEGEVHIQAERDTDFDHVQITFEGSSIS